MKTKNENFLLSIKSETIIAKAMYSKLVQIKQ